LIGKGDSQSDGTRRNSRFNGYRTNPSYRQLRSVAIARPGSQPTIFGHACDGVVSNKQRPLLDKPPRQIRFPAFARSGEQYGPVVNGHSGGFNVQLRISAM
jgi:hypothetical protein